ncbi:MAG: hypothetical protein AAGF19_12105, partial [Pseudomonadota bacterium]
IDQFLNKPETDVVPRQAAGAGTELTLSEKDFLRQQIYKCWRAPAGAANPEELIVTLRITFSRDGKLSEPPRVLQAGTSTFGGSSMTQAAAESAKRAVLKCQPYQLPVEKYNSWRVVDMVFDPSRIVGR